MQVLCSEECNEDGNNSDEEILSDDDLISDNPDEEYLFPTPDEISNAKTPVVGMVFSSLEEAVRFVNVYGQLAGFSQENRVTRDRRNRGNRGHEEHYQLNEGEDARNAITHNRVTRSRSPGAVPGVTSRFACEGDICNL